jgi:predicted alpha/beta hydrolase family esterase
MTHVRQQVLFIQGGGAGVHDEWDNKLVASLTRELGEDYAIRYPRMPNEADPDYAAWKSTLANEIRALTDGAVLVGHSIGGTILIHALAEQRPERKLAAVFLIAAPFVGPGGWPSEDIEPKPDLGARLPQATSIYLYHGSDDDTAPCAHVDLHKQAIPQAHVRKLEGRDHQLNEDLSEIAAEIRRTCAGSTMSR